MLSMDGVTAMISRDMCIATAASYLYQALGSIGLDPCRQGVGALAVPGCDANSMSCTPVCVRICEQRLVLVAHMRIVMRSVLTAVLLLLYVW
jgi:hypothetical protein